MDVLVETHGFVRWLVLLALVGSAVYSFVQAGRRQPWDETSDRPFSLTAILFDIQVALGIVLWLGNSGWDEGFFVAVIHPIGALVALGFYHVALARARRSAREASWAMLAVGAVIALAITTAVIPWAR